MRFSKKKVLLIIICIFVLFSVLWTLFPFLAFLAFFRPQVRIKQTSSVPVKRVTVYQDNRFGFKFNYPDVWVISIDERLSDSFPEKIDWPRRTIHITSEPYPTGTGKRFPTCVYSITVFSNPDNLEPNSYYRKRFEGSTWNKEELSKHLANIKDVYVNNQNAVKITTDDAIYLTGGKYAFQLQADNSYVQPPNNQYQCWEVSEIITQSFETPKNTK